MNMLFYGTGVVVWLIVSIVLIYLVSEFIWGFACSISFHRWCYSRAKADSRQLKWRALPFSLLKKSFEFMGHRNHGKGGASWGDDKGGYWHGIGDWSIGWRGNKNA